MQYQTTRIRPFSEKLIACHIGTQHIVTPDGQRLQSFPTPIWILLRKLPKNRKEEVAIIAGIRQRCDQNLRLYGATFITWTEQ